jgi:photosystem II stability/assembly factor-like uncharacterized protein
MLTVDFCCTLTQATVTIEDSRCFDRVKTTLKVKNRSLISTAIVGVLLLLPYVTVRATWTPIFRNPFGVGFTAGFFIDDKEGFIAGRGDQGVFKTTDGGATWTQILLNPLPPGTNGSVNILVSQIYMLDRMHGWLTIDQQFLNFPGLYETTDGGNTWSGTSYRYNATNVYRTSKSLIVTTRDSVGIGATSIDNQNFSYLPALNSTNGIDFTDDLHGVITRFTDRLSWLRTTDGGLTWVPTDSLEYNEAWSVYAVKGEKKFYVAGEHENTGLTWINLSTDNGAGWTKITTLPIETTGHIGGVADTALYVQSYIQSPLTKQQGLYRSTDKGKTWVYVGGPWNNRDTRFIVMGCRGEVVIAFDSHGNVWKTTDGGDGAFPSYRLPTTSGIQVDSIEACESRDTMLNVQNLSCDTLYITSAIAPASPRLDVLDPSGDTAHFPYKIPPGSLGSILLRLINGSSSNYQTTIILELTRDGTISFDTIAVRSGVKFLNPLLLASSIRFDSLSLCGSADSSIVIVNPSCFAIQIVNAQLKYGSNFSLVTSYNNDSILADSNKKFVVRFAPNKLGVLVDSLILNVLELGKPMRLSYPMRGIGKTDQSKFVLSIGPEINFDTVTICDTVQPIAFTMTNPGCTYLHVKVDLFDSTLKKPPPPNEFLWGIYGKKDSIHNGDTIIAAIQVLPHVVGYYRGYLRVIDIIDGKKPDTTLIPYTVDVTHGTKILSLDTSARNFGTITFCSQQDLTIPLRNLGCDTLHIIDSLSLGSNFILLNTSKNPFAILPGQSYNMQVRYVPNVSGAAYDSLIIKSDADGSPLNGAAQQIRTIPLAGSAIPTDTVSFKAVCSTASVQPGDIVSVVIIPSRTITNKGLNVMSITLEYNGDIMTPLPATASTTIPNATVVPPIEVRPGKFALLPIQIRGVNLSLDSTKPMVSIQFRITLSDSDRTDFHISDFSLNNSDRNFGQCVLGAVSDTGTIALNFACGDSLLFRFMQLGSNFSLQEGIAPAAMPINPNPVDLSKGESVNIPFKATRAGTLRLAIYNAIGSTIYSEIKTVVTACESSFILSNVPFASGTYHYSIIPLDGGSTLMGAGGHGFVTGEFVLIR